MPTIDRDLDPIRIRHNPWPFVAIAGAVFIAFMLGMGVTYKHDRKLPDFRSACTLSDANGGDVFPLRKAIPEIASGSL